MRPRFFSGARAAGRALQHPTCRFVLSFIKNPHTNSLDLSMWKRSKDLLPNLPKSESKLTKPETTWVDLIEYGSASVYSHLAPKTKL